MPSSIELKVKFKFRHRLLKANMHLKSRLETLKSESDCLTIGTNLPMSLITRNVSIDQTIPRILGIQSVLKVLTVLTASDLED